MITSAPFHGLYKPGAAGGGFSLSDVAGLTLWLKADGITDKSDGDLVDQWDDFSGNGFHGTASGALRATYKVNIENGKPAVLFSGAQYFATTQRNNLINVNNYAIFIVAKLPDYSLAASQFFFSDTGARLIAYSNTSGNLAGRHDTGLPFDQSAGAPTDGVITVFDIRHDESYGGADTRRHEVKRSGGTVNGNFGIGPLTATGGTEVMHVGGRPTVARFVTGYIFEVAIYNSSVSDADRTSIRSHLATKYGFVYS
jgi:hypothetical protein